MKKEFIPYQQALDLKELGFDEPCFATIDQTDYLHINGTKKIPRGSMMYDTIDCATFSQAFRWFREKYDCHHTIQHNKKYVAIVYSSVKNFSIDEYETYEQAELQCLKKLIEIVKNK